MKVVSGACAWCREFTRHATKTYCSMKENGFCDYCIKIIFVYHWDVTNNRILNWPSNKSSHPKLFQWIAHKYQLGRYCFKLHIFLLNTIKLTILKPQMRNSTKKGIIFFTNTNSNNLRKCDKKNELLETLLWLKMFICYETQEFHFHVSPSSAILVMSDLINFLMSAVRSSLPFFHKRSFKLMQRRCSQISSINP